MDKKYGEVIMKEGIKLKNILKNDELIWFFGKGIDIGGFDEKIFPNFIKIEYDLKKARNITSFIKDKFDCVYSSYFLQHFEEPYNVMLEFWKLVKKNGYMIIIVPDEDLYEQGFFPSKMCNLSKHTFTISKRNSWCDKSINLLDLANKIPNSKIIKIELQDNNYDRKKMKFQDNNFIDQTIGCGLSQIMLVLQKNN